MAREPLTPGFQLILPDSERFKTPADKAQNGQQSNTQQKIDHEKGQQQNDQGHLSAIHIQNTTPPGLDNVQQHQQLQMQVNYHQTGQPAHGNSPNQQHHCAMMSPFNGINQQHVQHTHGQTMMAQGTPGRHQQQAIMSANNQNIDQATISYNSNNQQFADSAQHQNMMSQSALDPQLLPQGAMYTNSYNNLQADQINHGSTQQDIQTTHSRSMLASGSLDAQQHRQSFLTNNIGEQFHQSNTGSPMFNQQYHPLPMPGIPLSSPVSQGNMFSNNIIGQQGHMGAMAGMEQFQQLPGFSSIVENCIRQMLAGSAQSQIANHMASIQQQQQQQPYVPVTHSHDNSEKVFFPPQSPSPAKAGQFVHPASALNTPHAKRKAETPVQGRTKRPALANDNGIPDDTAFPRDDAKLVIMIAQNIWSTLMTIGNRMVESRNVFGLQIAFGYSPTTTDGGLSNETRNEMIKMHQSLMYCSLITYGLQGCRLQELPTFSAGEVYMPTRVFPPGSQKAIYVTPVRSPAMPVADNQHPVATTTPPTPSQPKPAQTRKGTGPAKSRGKRPSVCIPTVQQEENGALLSLETGEKVPVAGMSKNQLKKMARQVKSEQPLDDGGEMAVAYRNRDFATVEKLLGQMKAEEVKASTPAKNNKGSSSIPPPKKLPRESRAMKEALAEGAKAIASGKARPPTRGRSQSVATKAGNSNITPASQPFGPNSANANSSPASQASTPSPYHLGGPPVQPQPQPTMPYQFTGSPPQVSQGYRPAACPQQAHQSYQFDDQFQPQQQPDMGQQIDPQLMTYDGQAQQLSAPMEHCNTGLGSTQKENQLPVPASVDELLKASSLIVPTGQQATSSAITDTVDGIDITPINDIGQQGQVFHQEQRPQAASSAIIDSVDGIEITPVNNPGNARNNQAQARMGAPAKGHSVAHLKNIQSYNGMSVINGEVQTNGYGMQPLAAIMPQGIPPRPTGFGSRTEDKSITATPRVCFPEPATLARNDTYDHKVRPAVNQDLDMEDLFGPEVFGPEEPLSGLDALTRVDLEQAFDYAGLQKEHEEQIARELADDAARLQPLADFNNDASGESAMPQFDGGDSPIISDKTRFSNQANFYQDPSGSKSSSVLAGAAARAQQNHQNNIARQAQGQTSGTAPKNSSSAPPNVQAALTPEQIRAHEVYRQHLLHTQRDLTALRARDNRRNRALAADRDLPSQAERERRAKRKRAHERIANLKYVTAQAMVFPKGHAQRFGFEEAIDEMHKLEEEVRKMEDKVLTNREYAVVREKGYRCEEHWIPEI